MFTIIWKFRINPLFKSDFEKLYGPAGKWVVLFQKAPGYVATELLHDSTDENIYVIIDRWQSKKMYEEFLVTFADEYKILDVEGENFTVEETKIGWFDRIEN